MPKVHPRLMVALCTLSLVALCLIVDANAQRSAIDTYAITNARIVTVSGPIVERGTVVIRNGLIAAAGPNISAPPDARVIDGAGLTVYPGLIDAYTNLALPEPAPGPSPGGGPAAFLLVQPQTRPVGGPNSTQPAGLQPEVMVEDSIRSTGTDIESSRNIGITTALSAPRSGIWMGQSALINLSGETPQQMIVRSPIAMHVSFTPLRGGYPGSLMGVFATAPANDARRATLSRFDADLRSQSARHPQTGNGSIAGGARAGYRRTHAGDRAGKQRTRNQPRTRSGCRVQTEIDRCGRTRGRSRSGSSGETERPGAAVAKPAAPHDCGDARS